MIKVAYGEKLELHQNNVQLKGWALECRIYAEDPFKNFLPSTGRLKTYKPPLNRYEDTVIIRNDSGVDEGGEISMYYDPMISKLCTWCETREKAIILMESALDEYQVEDQEVFFCLVQPLCTKNFKIISLKAFKTAK